MRDHASHTLTHRPSVMKNRLTIPYKDRAQPLSGHTTRTAAGAMQDEGRVDDEDMKTPDWKHWTQLNSAGLGFNVG